MVHLHTQMESNGNMETLRLRLCFNCYFGILSLSEGRSGFVASILLICSFTVFEIWKRRKILGLLIILLAPIALYEASAHHSRMSEEMLRNEPRLALWHSAVDLITKSP